MVFDDVLDDDADVDDVDDDVDDGGDVVVGVIAVRGSLLVWLKA
jgi:hypothetical protein